MAVATDLSQERLQPLETVLAQTPQKKFEAVDDGQGEVVVSVKNVSKKFCKNLRRSMAYGIVDLARNFAGIKPNSSTLRKDEFWALDGVSFELRRGEALGLIGVNGSGKTTILRLIAGIFPPDKGKIVVKGRVGALIAVGAGFHPYMTGRENIYLNGAILGMTRDEIDARFQDIVDFAEIGDFVDAPVSTYSSGMRVRLGFSVATAIDPDVLLLDEILAVGDMGFRAKCFNRIGRLIEKTAVIFVSHSLPQVSRICDRTILLHKGRIALMGATETAIEKYESILRNSTQLHSRTVLDPCIRSFSCRVIKETLEYGETLGLELSFDSEKEIKAGLCLIAISAFDAFHAQTDFTRQFPRIPKGKSVFFLEVGPMYLRKDKYSVSTTITGESGKSTWVHAIRCATFLMNGQRGYGVAYQVPVVRITVAQVQDAEVQVCRETH